MASQHCRTEAEGCKVQHDARGSCYSQQCSTCEAKAELGEGLAEVELFGAPENNAFCYMDTPHDTLIKRVISPGEIHAFQIEPVYTNLNMRLVFDTERYQGLRYHLATSSGAGRNQNVSNSSLLEFGEFEWRGVEQSARVVGESQQFEDRAIVVVDFNDHNFQTTKLYLLIEGLEGVGNSNTSATEFNYRFFYTQPKMKLDLVIFFISFFSAFYVLIFIFTPWIYLRAASEARNAEQLEQQQLEEMATRPMACVRLLMTEGIVGAEQARRVADLHARRAITATPVACQPIGDHENFSKDEVKAMIASYVVELPSHPGFRNVCIGAALVVVPSAVEERKITKRYSSTAL
jgi:hypothetical protein